MKNAQRVTSDFGFIAQNESYCYKLLVQPLGKHIRKAYTYDFSTKKYAQKAYEIKCLRADPKQGIRASVYRIMMKLQYKMTKKLTALSRRLFL